jgi:hypothetical protein
MTGPIHNKSKSLFQYSGNIDLAVSSIVLKEIKHDLLPKLSETIPTRKIYQAFVETIENVIKYNGDHKINLYLTEESEDFIRFTVQNIIRKDDALILDQRLKTIMSLDNDALKSKIRAIIQGPNEMEDNGAGLGLIMLVSKNNKEVDYFIDAIDDDNTLFSITFNFKSTA